MSKVTRNFDVILADLTAVEDNSDDHKVQVMAYALRWGYASLRCHHALESHLRHQPDLADYVKLLAGVWDGQSYMSGALRAAKEFVVNDFDTAAQLAGKYREEVNHG